MDILRKINTKIIIKLSILKIKDFYLSYLVMFHKDMLNLLVSL